jgi:hypothetical protein
MLILCLPVAFLPAAMRSRRWLAVSFWVIGGVSIALALLGSYRPFLPSTQPVVGQPAIVDNTIWLALQRLATLSTPLGLIRLLLVGLIVYAAYFLLWRGYQRSRSAENASHASGGAEPDQRPKMA